MTKIVQKAKNHTKSQKSSHSRKIEPKARIRPKIDPIAEELTQKPNIDPKAKKSIQMTKIVQKAKNRTKGKKSNQRPEIHQKSTQ